MTQSEIANKIALSQGAWGLIENNKRNLTLDKLKLLVINYHVRSEWIIHGEGDVFDWQTIPHDAQWKRLLVLRYSSMIFSGTPRIAAKKLSVPLETYQNWEMGLEPIPEDVVDRIYGIVKNHIRKEWWYEGKGEKYVNNPFESPEKIREPKPGEEFGQEVPVDFSTLNLEAFAEAEHDTPAGTNHEKLTDLQRRLVGEVNRFSDFLKKKSLPLEVKRELLELLIDSMYQEVQRLRNNPPDSEPE